MTLDGLRPRPLGWPFEVMDRSKADQRAFSSSPVEGRRWELTRQPIRRAPALKQSAPTINTRFRALPENRSRLRLT